MEIINGSNEYTLEECMIELSNNWRYRVQAIDSVIEKNGRYEDES